MAAGKMFLFGEAHYPVALVCPSLGPDGGRGGIKKIFFRPIELSTLLFLNTRTDR